MKNLHLIYSLLALVRVRILIILWLLLNIMLGNNFICYAEGIDELSVEIRFQDLHLTDNLKLARISLKDISGVYCIVNLITETMYIGSSVDIGDRIMDHLVYNHRSNAYLQNAITKYGLSAFAFYVLHLCEPKDLIQKEQEFLNWLFSLPEKYRYNFLRIAGSSYGAQHTEDTRTKISNSMKGNVNALGKTPSVEARKRMSESHMGQLPGNAIAVYVYSLEWELVETFSSITETAKWLNVHQSTVSRYVKSGKSYNNLYYITKTAKTP